MAWASFKLTRVMVLLLVTPLAGIHVRQYFFPSLRGFGILSAHATISVIVIGFTIAKFCIQTQRDFLRREAFPVPEYSVDVILKDGPCGQSATARFAIAIAQSQTLPLQT
jgi:hypothetical protein